MSTTIATAELNSLGYIDLIFFQENVTLSEADVKYGWDLTLSIDPQKKLAVYLKTAPWSLLDNEARSYVIKEIKERSFVAILVHNLGQRIMGNFATNLIGKSSQVEIFVKDDLAKQWLLEKLKQ